MVITEEPDLFQDTPPLPPSSSDVFPVNEEAKKLIQSLGLEPHPEGGWCANTYRSSAHVVRDCAAGGDAKEERCALTAAYFMLAGREFSQWHQLKSDEVWLYHAGGAAKLHTIDTDGNYKQRMFGNPMLSYGASFEYAIPRGTWFACELADNTSYCLLSCIMGPGWTSEDFTLASKDLADKHPEHKDIIQRLLR